MKKRSKKKKKWLCVCVCVCLCEPTQIDLKKKRRKKPFGTLTTSSSRRTVSCQKVMLYSGIKTSKHARLLVGFFLPFPPLFWPLIPTAFHCTWKRLFFVLCAGCLFFFSFSKGVPLPAQQEAKKKKSDCVCVCVCVCVSFFFFFTVLFLQSWQK